MEDAASRYRILGPLGRGGMGEVHLAHDARLDRRVALKFLSSASGDAAVRRLLREARSSAALDHPFICKTYETGELDDRPFIAMEYVEGETLKARLERGPLAMREALALAREMADALDYAHRRGIVHRDLKPGNVMVTPEGHVKLLDFGVARRDPAASGAAADADATMTATMPGALSGTLAYMAPEQLAGMPGDAQSDIFAFGIVLHEMLTGAHPFARPSRTAMVGAILNEPAPLLGSRLAGVPDVLEHVLGRMLSKERDTRYQSAREIRADFDALTGARPRAPAAAGRRLWPLAVAAALAALAGAAWLPGWFGADDPALAFKERDWVLIADFENLTGDAAFGPPLQAALRVAIEQSQYVNVVPAARIREARQRAQRPDDAPLDVDLASELAVREGARAVVAGSVAQVGDAYMLTARLVDPAPRIAVQTESVRVEGRGGVLKALDELAGRLRRQLGESLASIEQGKPLPLATTASLEALSLYVQARDDDAEPATKVSLLREAIAIDSDFALAHADLGLALYLGGQRAEGDKHFERALSLLNRLTTREQLWIRALVEDTRGRREAAVEQYQAYLAQYPDDTGVLFRLGWTLMAPLNQPEQAAETFRRLLAIDPNNPHAQVNLATCYSSLGRGREAVDAYEKAFALRPEYRTGLYINHEYGFTLVALGEIDEAAEAFRTMAALQDPTLRARGLRSQALLDMYRGRYAAAAETLREAILVNRAHRMSLSELRDRLFRAMALEATRRTALAREEVLAAARLADQMTLAPDWLYLLGWALVRHGRVTDAEQLLARAPATAADPTAVSGIARGATSDYVAIQRLQGEIALARGRAVQALEHYDTAHRLAPDARSRAALARVTLALQRPAEAAAWLEELIETSAALGSETQEPWLQAHLQLGELHEQAGRIEDARALYEKLLAIWTDADPDLPAARDARARLARLAARDRGDS